MKSFHVKHREINYSKLPLDANGTTTIGSFGVNVCFFRNSIDLMVALG